MPDKNRKWRTMHTAEETQDKERPLREAVRDTLRNQDL